MTWENIGKSFSWCPGVKSLRGKKESQMNLSSHFRPSWKNWQTYILFLHLPNWVWGNDRTCNWNRLPRWGLVTNGNIHNRITQSFHLSHEDVTLSHDNFLGHRTCVFNLSGHLFSVFKWLRGEVTSLRWLAFYLWEAGESYWQKHEIGSHWAWVPTCICFFKTTGLSSYI